MDQDTCDVILNDVQTSFLWYPYPLVSGFITDETTLPGLKLCTAEDIAVMKLSAIGSRGSRKFSTICIRFIKAFRNSIQGRC